MADKKVFTQEREIPEGVTLTLEGSTVIAKGAKGEVKRVFNNPMLAISTKDNQIIISSKRGTQREKKLVNTTAAHIKNMINGAQNGHEYKLKICSGHFPMNVTVSGNELVIKNFLGEKHPRKMSFDPANVKLTVQGQDIVLEGIDLEYVGQCAANIEKLTRVTNRDRRIFQDGIYITHKKGEPIK